MSRLVNIEKSLKPLRERSTRDALWLRRFPSGDLAGDTLPGQWIEVSYIPLSEEFPVGRVRVGWGSERQLLLNANCFEQRAEQIGQIGGLANQYFSHADG